MVNKVILIGNLGSDPEVKYLESGTTVANFSLATTESYKDRSGQRVKTTEWHRIELWEGLAKVAAEYLKKGDSVYIEGKIKTESWNDKDGNTHKTVKIRATALTMLGNKQQGQSNAPAQQSKPVQQQLATNGSDDLPF